jgi:hypothetical protein
MKSSEITAVIIKHSDFVVVKKEQQQWHLKREHVQPKRSGRLSGMKDHFPFRISLGTFSVKENAVITLLGVCKHPEFN